VYRNLTRTMLKIDTLTVGDMYHVAPPISSLPSQYFFKKLGHGYLISLINEYASKDLI